MAMKPIKLYWTPGPNPAKVLIVLEELGLPYESHFVAKDQVKSKEYIAVNPNGRMPSIQDPNQDLVLWESGAIMQYLIDMYDKENKISFSTLPEKYLTQQYSYFQASGQGPYFGQAAWFNNLHEKTYGESPESAKVRYGNELKRVVGVLDDILSKQEWLVGGKCTYADLSFCMWNAKIAGFMSSRTGEHAWKPEEFPHFTKWQNAMLARGPVQKVLSAMLNQERVVRSSI